jgi:hypothetical protein
MRKCFRSRACSRLACADVLESRQLLAGVTVRYDSFDNTTGLQLNGSAASFGTAGSRVLRLTQAVSGDGGSAFSSIRVSASKFSTFFSFRISNPGGGAEPSDPPGADGLAFVIQPLSSTIGGAGAGIGYGGIDKSVAVEFDIFRNDGNGWEEFDDPSSNHIGITTLGNPDHGAGSPFTKNITPDFDNGQLWYAWIDYNGTNLEVRVRTGDATRPTTPTLTRTLNVAQILEQSEAYIGFTAATGLDWAVHDVVRWEYRSDYDPITSTPEAEVRGNNLVIADNDTTPSLNDHTDFGVVAVGGSPVYRTFTVRNVGQSALSTSGLVVPSGFTVTQSLLSSIAPGASDTFTVKLNTTAAGAYSGNISFANNDANENPYNFAIKGSVNAPTAPEVEVRANNVVIADNDTTPSLADRTDFGTVNVGTSLTQIFTVRNLGTAGLYTNTLSVPSGFTIVEGLAGYIAPGDSNTFSVRLNATAAGTFVGNISFNTNDANEDPYNFAIKGVVNQPTFSLISGVLTVTGTSGPDYIRGSIASNVLTMKVNNLSQTFAGASSISRIVVNALAGNDLIILASSVNRPTSLNGGDGNDTIAGGSGIDVINGGAGTDSAFRSGSDTVSLVEEVLS